MVDPALAKELGKAAKQNDDVSMVNQINTEYTLAFQYTDPKRQEWGARQRLYNNQKRDKLAIGDPLSFTTLQTVLAALYDDKRQQVFDAREEEYQCKADNLNEASDYDADVMGLDMIEYDWSFNTLFFGKGVLLMSDYDRQRLVPVPKPVNMMNFLWDPRCTSLNTTDGKPAARFFGREVFMTKREMRLSGVPESVISNVRQDSTINGLTDKDKEYRDQAQGFNTYTFQERLEGENEVYRVLEWFTFRNGKMYMQWWANMRQLCIKEVALPEGPWAAIERSIYPIPGDFIGASIMDLVEDKQRMRAKLQNLSLKSTEFGVYNMYLYDKNKIKNKSDISTPEPNKMIPTDGETGNAITPVPRIPISNDVQFMLQVMNDGAEKATATPAIRQGATPDTTRTATERAIQSKGVDTRFALASKIFGWSQKRFWMRWYSLQKEHLTEHDEKYVRSMGPTGPKWKKFSKSDLIIKEYDPDVRIESATIVASERREKLMSFSNLLQQVKLDPTANMRYGYKELSTLSGLKKDQREMLLPPTPEEIHAEMENEVLNEGKLPQLLLTDDHIAHIEIHSMAEESKERDTHIHFHKLAMMAARQNPQLLPAGLNGPQGIASDNNPQPAGEGVGTGPGAASQPAISYNTSSQMPV